MNANTNFELLFKQLPEQELWRLLQDVIADEIELDDGTIRQLDAQMQGFLFLQEYVSNREARIDFARSPRHMPYMRDAAGSRNVWMSDAEFSEFVNQDDAETLACFARSQQMKPHQLLYIEYKLSIHPHQQEMLASAYDAMITTKKSLELHGNPRVMALIRLAKAALEGSAELDTVMSNRVPGAVVHSNGDPRALWRAYLNLKNLDEGTLLELLETAGLSTRRPNRASDRGAASVH